VELGSGHLGWAREVALHTGHDGGQGLEVHELSVHFGGLKALDRVSFDVGMGEVVGVIGPNGAGKTTLFNVISGFLHPSGGVVRWRGRDLRHHRPHDLGRLGIARTLQGVGLWPRLTVAENVACGGEPSLRADVVSAIAGLWRSSGEERRLSHRVGQLLEELDIAQWAGRLPGALPHGVQKRVALARALMCDPALLLLDEPASGLSETDMADLSARIHALRARMSVVLVEHHMDLVMAICDRVVVLDFGQLVAAGTPEEIRSSPAVTTAYLGVAVGADVDASESDHAAG
jgi:branched-chain amino acid transport system ATP-binding protein